MLFHSKKLRNGMQRHRHGTAYRLPMTIKNSTMAFVKTQGLFYPDYVTRGTSNAGQAVTNSMIIFAASSDSTKIMTGLAILEPLESANPEPM